MRKIKLPSIILVALIFSAGYSCKSVKSDKEPFVKTIAVKGEPFIHADQLSDIRAIKIFKNYLFIIRQLRAPQVEVYDLSKKKKVASSFDSRSDILFVGNLQYDVKKERLYIFDLYESRLFGCDFDTFVSNGRIEPAMMVNMQENTGLYFSNLMLVGNTLVGEDEEYAGRFYMFDLNKKKGNYMVSYPDVDMVNEQLTDLQNSALYNGKSVPHPTKNKIASVTGDAGMIDLYEVNQDSIKAYWSYNEFYPKGIAVERIGNTTRAVYTDESVRGFCDLCVSEKYIYALYSGKSINDDTFLCGNTVYVLDWEGNRTFKIILDNDINRIAISGDDKTLYGLTQSGDIIKFPTPK